VMTEMKIRCKGEAFVVPQMKLCWVNLFRDYEVQILNKELPKMNWRDNRNPFEKIFVKLIPINK
jgi:hypothetical protein